MTEPFFKYQGLGNDFVILDRRGSGIDVDAAFTRWACDRHWGVGADGVLVILPDPEADARMVVHNADGSIAENCGNGIRCVAAHVAGQRNGTIAIRAGESLNRCSVTRHNARFTTVEVAMGSAKLTGDELPPGPWVDVPFEGRHLTAVSFGNPHCVVLDAQDGDDERLGPKLEHLPAFPKGANVGFCRQREGGGVALRVWERGVGFTLACGTGACAAVVALGLAGRLPFGEWNTVRLPGGELEVRSTSDLSLVEMRGPAERVFEGALPAGIPGSRAP